MQPIAQKAFEVRARVVRLAQFLIQNPELVVRLNNVMEGGTVERVAAALVGAA
jgi:hypothetical protein